MEGNCRVLSVRQASDEVVISSLYKEHYNLRERVETEKKRWIVDGHGNE